jgi:DNA-binding transcriptional LysR family regulator
MNYTLHQLQVFLRVAELESITRAAESLHLTQPAVSVQLKNFQDQFEIPLTEIVGRKLFVTDFGKEIALAAAAILDQVDAIHHKTQAHKGFLTGRLKLSIVSTGKYVMPYFLSGFMKKHTGIELQMDVTNKRKVIDSLEMNAVDFSLVSVLPEHLKIEQVELMQNRLFLVGRGGHGFDAPQYDAHIFESLPLIYREPGSGTRQTMEKYIEQMKIPVRKNMELTSNEAVKQAVIAGLGFSIMPLIGIKNELSLGDLQIIGVKGFPITSFWRLIWLKNKNFSLAAAAFLEYIKQEKDNIIREQFEWFERY